MYSFFNTQLLVFYLHRCASTTLHGLCNDFPDWSIAATGSEDSVRIGYDSVHSVTGEEHHLTELDVPEEQLQGSSEGDQKYLIPWERTLVATSIEVRTYVLKNQCSFLQLAFYVFRCFRSLDWMQLTLWVNHHPFLSQHYIPVSTTFLLYIIV